MENDTLLPLIEAVRPADVPEADNDEVILDERDALLLVAESGWRVGGGGVHHESHR